MTQLSDMQSREITLHGHRLSYRVGGAGPVLVLVHGISSSNTTWDDVLPWLAEHHTIVAPDLLGHGRSAKPRGDYSLGAYANGLRDLIDVLGHQRVTLVGHSLGGGIAMQFTYQFPERCERLVLVSSGGLGREVHVMLRAAALPGSEWVLPVICTQGLLDTVAGAARFFGRAGLRVAPDLEEIWRGYAALGDVECRQAFVHTLRTIIDPGGQRVSATDRLYLAAGLPTMIVWGNRDGVIPVAHAHAAHAVIAGSRLEVFPGAGHFPHRSDPRRFVEVLRDFVRATEPARLDDARWRERLKSGGAA
jgi:pimeloyl-ACP methyl ester carboxylesterase